jgi:hypothetical protein
MGGTGHWVFKWVPSAQPSFYMKGNEKYPALKRSEHRTTIDNDLATWRKENSVEQHCLSLYCRFTFPSRQSVSARVTQKVEFGLTKAILENGIQILHTSPGQIDENIRPLSPPQT